jgi:cytidylate kinase
MAIPVIAIDGPSASGKGTVAARVARALGFHLLDSGAIYRACALAALDRGVALDDEAALARLGESLDVRFDGDEVWLDGAPAGARLRGEAAGGAASAIAALPALRAALLARQHGFRRAPGLVADGRDMGSVVFPDARPKIFLTASPEARAERRYKQLIEKGLSANLPALVEELRARDARDSARAAAPLRPADDALVVDSTAMSIEQVVQEVLHRWQT